jgi:hypothetical protein
MLPPNEGHLLELCQVPLEEHSVSGLFGCGDAPNVPLRLHLDGEHVSHIYHFSSERRYALSEDGQLTYF